MRRTASPSEHAEQVALIGWAALNESRWPELRLLFAIPNGGKRGIVTAVMIKREGGRSGIPDLFLPVCRSGFFGLFIELKRETGSRLAPNQEWWFDQLTRQGYAVCVAHGAHEATQIITSYMENSLCLIGGET